VSISERICSDYKKTEVGAIPANWDTVELKELIRIDNGFAFSSSFFSDQGVQLLTPGNFTLDGRLYFNERNTKRYSGPYLSTSVFEKGDLLIVMTDLTPDCNLLGKPAFINCCEPLLHNQRIGKIIPLSQRISRNFLYWYFLSDVHARRMKETATGSTVRHTSNVSIYRSLIALPPLPEQRAIAAALSDVDALIASLDALIAKKRDLKQAAMQQLLTGKTRLPGFSLTNSTFQRTDIGIVPDDWSLSTVGDEFEIQLGKMLDAEKNKGVPKPYVGNRAVQWDKIDINELSLMAMTASDLRRFRLRQGDLLVCEGGEVGRAAIWEAPLVECYYQKALHRLRPRRGFNPRLMIGFLQLWSARGILSNFVTQTSIAHLPKDKLLLIPLPVPSAA
jgi:type I restriction enzyme, S subunit